MKTLFDLCTPRPDVLRGNVKKSDFAADLAQVLNGNAPKEYRDPATFFANTHPTAGLRNLLKNVCARLSGHGGQAAAIFRLDTQYGGGKTHSLIALSHAARGMKGVANAAELVDAALIPKDEVRVAAFDGENADAVNGRPLGQGPRGVHAVGRARGRLADKKGGNVVLRDPRRAANGALGPTDGTCAMIDALHHAAWRARHGPPGRARAAREEQRRPVASFEAVLTAVREVLPVGKTFTKVERERGAVAEASSDFDAVEQLRRFAYAEQGPKSVQLAMWEEA